MYSNKDNKMKYFLGGSAVGIAAGLLIGKITKNTSRVQAQTSKAAAINNEKTMEYSQDDNIYNLSRFNNVHSGRVRSKSSSQYDNVDWKDESKVYDPFLTKLDNFLANNTNDLSLNEKPNKRDQKEFYNNIAKFHNTSVEDNIEIENLSEVINVECTANSKTKKLLKRSNHCTSTELSVILNSSFNDDVQSYATDESVSENSVNDSNLV